MRTRPSHPSRSHAGVAPYYPLLPLNRLGLHELPLPELRLVKSPCHTDDSLQTAAATMCNIPLCTITRFQNGFTRVGAACATLPHCGETVRTFSCLSRD
eukprot:6212612-Pleurochrysis_carterae.AAC.2